jgi:hypothetical protein
MRNVIHFVFWFAGVMWWRAPAMAADPSGVGYPEPVVHWLVEPGETCADVAVALYESERHVTLIHRYNDVDCTQPLPTARLLILPMNVTAPPVARLGSTRPVVRARPPEGSWVTANSGMTFNEGYGVNTLQRASAELLFRDSSRVLLQENTLVVIYDSAKRTLGNATPDGSHVAVSEGELRAAVAPLRGVPVRVATEDGAKVELRGQDASVRRRSGRTAVSVFDGGARVTSAETAVDVPAEHGTTFYDRAPPWRPKPLPVAPEWVGGTGRLMSVRHLAPPGSSPGSVRLSWASVPAIVGYRVELARDVGFRDVWLREEIPARISSLQLTGLPPGAYYVRVQGVDEDGLLGMPSVPRAVWILGVWGDFVRAQNHELVHSAYAPLRLMSGDGLSIDMQSAVGLDEAVTGYGETRGQTVVWKGQDGAEERVRIVAEVPKVELLVHWVKSETPTIRIQARVVGRQWNGGDPKYGGLTPAMWADAGFRVRLEQGETQTNVLPRSPTPGGWTTDVEVPTDEALAVAWEDRHGTLLARVDLGRRVVGGDRDAGEVSSPTQFRLPGHSLPLVGVGGPTRGMLAIQGGAGERNAVGSAVVSGRLSRMWSLAGDVNYGLGQGQTQTATGGLAAYAHEQLARHWYLGIRGGLRLPFSLDGNRLLVSGGIGGEYQWSTLRLLAGVDARVPVGNGGSTRLTTMNYLLGVAWVGREVPLRGFAFIEAGQAWNRAPGELSEAGYVGAEIGRRWVGGVSARFGHALGDGPDLAVQTTLSYHLED